MTKKFIVTDPCYIIHRVAYDTLGAVSNWEFEELKMPLTVSYTKEEPYNNTMQKLTLHKIVGTGGDGSVEWKGQLIGVDAGMLCIAEKETGWKDEQYGATFESVGEARKALRAIIKHWL